MGLGAPPPPGLLSNAIDEVILWSVSLLFLPMIVRDRWRRRRERQSDKGREARRAADDVVEKIRSTLESESRHGGRPSGPPPRGPDPS